jgi:alkanesulfonate monooxygenase SsuD/methylene tetrahydromethanopterin reductase-like flavin-dependent oxidoreductase (luciferase family)
MAEVRFGLNVPTTAEPGTDPARAARKAEELGFDFVSSSDHPGGSGPSYETWTMLCWIAAATDRIHIASRVLGVPFRTPALLAKMAETLDRLSGGRLILGLGGGSGDDEFRAFGLEVPSPKEKIDGLEEAVTIIRSLWSQRDFSFDGRRYSVIGATIEPRPERRIPIWLGTFGPRSLAVTGHLADGWIPSLGYAPPEEVKVMRQRVLDAAVAAGRHPSEITCAYNIEVRLDGAPESPSVVSGSANEVAERLVGFTKLGFSAFNFMLSGADQDEQAERLAREVVPAVRAAA